MTQKTINTLVSDIYDLFDPNKSHTANEENLDAFANNIKEVLRLRLSARDAASPALRFSSLGRPDRQVWYAAQGEAPADMSAKTYFKFLYGDLIEQMILFLVKEAGHEVSHEQAEVEALGVKGHIDAIIDGVVVDVKSASPFGYKKFENGSVFEDDPFGYTQQISGYANAFGRPAAFLAFDKVAGDICVCHVPSSIIESHPPEPRIEHLREVISRSDPPPKCYSPVPDGKSGNEKLATGCSYCGFRNRCWPEARTFIYSTGPRYLTKVSKTPDVYEVKE